MATLSVTHLDDLGRVRIELVDPLSGVVYRVERSTDGGSHWIPVRGAQRMSSTGTTLVDDFEYAPNTENLYRLLAPAFYDSFQREYPPVVFEDFEDASLVITITDDGDAPWARSTAQAHTGSWSLRSGTITDEEYSSALVDVPAGATTLRFWYRVSSEEGFDSFDVWADTNLVLTDSGETGWVQSPVIDVSGVSVIEFSYFKDSSVTEGDDAVWIDDITFQMSGTGWGTADSGQTWVVEDLAATATLAVASGVGSVSDSAPSGDNATLTVPLPPAAVNAEVAWSGSVDTASLDQAVEFNVGLRASDADNYYEGQLIFNLGSQHALTVRISKHVGGTYTALTTAATLGRWTQNVPWHARFRVQGNALMIRAWQTGTSEPGTWQLVTNDNDLTTGTDLHIRARKASGAAYSQFFGPITVEAIPAAVDDTVAITPQQTDVWLKSVTYPMLNRVLECVDWQELERSGRAGFFDIKGRHERLGIADVGSTAAYSLTLITYSKEENRALVALLTYGGTLLLQPPGDDEDEDCPTAYSGTPEGYVMVDTYVQARTVYGKPMWLWTVAFVEVAEADVAHIIPTNITWSQLWDMIGQDGTWETVWATWPTWQDIWLTTGNPLALGG